MSQSLAAGVAVLQRLGARAFKSARRLERADKARRVLSDEDREAAERCIDSFQGVCRWLAERIGKSQNAVQEALQASDLLEERHAKVLAAIHTLDEEGKLKGLFAQLTEEYPVVVDSVGVKDSFGRGRKQNGRGRGVKPKKSELPGAARAKLIAALTKHHNYAAGSCLNTEPIGSNDLCRQAEVSKGSGTPFFQREFNGHTAYKRLCARPADLVQALRLLNGEVTPRILTQRDVADPSGDDDDGDNDE